MTEPWDLTEAQRRQFREAHAEAKRRQMANDMSRLTDDDRFLIAEARRIGPALRGRIGADDRERLAAQLLARLADALERLDGHAAAQVRALDKLAARWQSFGDGEDAQSACAAELREAIGRVG